MSIREDENISAEIDLARRNEQLRRLAATALLVNSTVETEELVATITAQAREAIGANHARTVLGDSFAPPAYAGEGEWPDVDGDLTAAVLADNRPRRTGTALVAPLVGRDGDGLGVIELAGKVAGEFDAEDEAILVQFAQMASAAVENARLHEASRVERDRLAAIAQMAETVERARSLEEIFEAGLTTIERATGAGRSSILLFDADGVMRFRAWHGLSDAYRAAVDGHSPWRPDALDPEPILVADVDEDAELAPYLPVFHAEGIRALAFVPLVHGGALIGKFMLYHAAPHTFGAGEVQLAQTIASHIASVVVRTRAEQARRESQTQLEVIFGGVADGITAQAPDGRLVYANDAAAQQLGFATAEELLAADVAAVVGAYEILDENRDPLTLDDLPGRVALRTGRSTSRTVCYRRRESGNERWSIVRATPVLGDDGSPQLAINIFHDITERIHAEERLHYLAEASDAFASSLDLEATLAYVARLTVPRLADYCIVDLVEGDGSLRQVVMTHRDPERELVLQEIRRRYPPERNPEHPVHRVIASGEPLLFEVVDDDVLRQASVDDDHLELYRRLDPSSYVVVPLIAHGRTIGAISMGAGTSGRHYSQRDVDLAVEVAQRAAVAVDNARLHAEAHASFALLDTLLVSAPVGIGFWDRDLRYVRVNDALARINGLPAEEHVGKHLSDVIPEMAHALVPLYRRVIETGEPMTHAESTDADARSLGSARHWLSSYYPVRTRDGETIGVGAVIMEVTAQRQAEQRLRLLAEAGELFSAPLERDEILHRVVRLVVPRVADACTIHLADADGRIVRVAHAHADTDAELALDALPAVLDGGEGAPALFRRVLETGVAVLAAEPHDELLADLERLGLDRASFAENEVGSAVFVPLVSHGRSIGVMTLGAGRTGRFNDHDLDLALELARRVSVALENSRLLGELTFRTTLLELQSEASLDGILVVSPEGDVSSYNRRFAELWQLGDDVMASRSDAAALDQALHRVADPEGFIRRVREIYASPARSRDEIVLRDGRTIDRYGAPIRDADGTYYGYLWSFRDVTAERRARSRVEFLAAASTLLASSLDYEQTLRHAATLAVAEIADFCAIYVREEGDEIRNVVVTTRDPARTAWAEDVVARFPPQPEDDYGAARVIRTGESTFMPEIPSGWIDEVLHAKPDLKREVETLQLVSSIVVPLATRGRTIGAISLTTTSDSNRRYNEDDLRLAEELARRASVAIDNARLFAASEARAQAAQALTFVADGVVLVDEEQVIRLWNPAAEAMTGLAAEDLLGRPLREAVPGWAVVDPFVPVAQADSGGLVRPETVPLDLAGRELWLSISGVAFPGGTVYAFRDLTEERAVERLKSDFVSTVSHELRTPLAAIYGAAMTLQRSDVTLAGDQRDAMLGVVAGEAERLARIVNDILLASRLDSGHLEVSIQNTDARVIAEAVLEAARAHAPENIALRLEAPAEVPPVAGDPEKVRQVLVNLLDNAVKYSPDGGSVILELRPFGHHLRFLVKDEGLGIPPSEHARVFEKFYRLDPNLTRGVGGTGLGLYICREMVRRMDGRIWVTAGERGGSTFAFELPIASSGP